MSIINTESVVIVQERTNPSTDFFVLPELSKGGMNIELIDHEEGLTAISLESKTIIFVRYIPKYWLKHIEQNRDQVRDVIFFIDDDLFDVKAFSGLSLRYKLKLLRLSYLRKSWLKGINAKLWVSTPFLAEKYASWNPELILPHPHISTPSPICVFYHGSASHMDEIRWLFPVIKAVLEKNSMICFEIIGNRKVNKLYKSLPRVSVIHPMGWESYRSFIGQRGRQIGLAPMLNKGFNAARSFTKFFDITQAGAIGLYADHEAFNSVIKTDINGVLLEMKPQVWVDAILALAEDGLKREQLIKEATVLCERLVGKEENDD